MHKTTAFDSRPDTEYDMNTTRWTLLLTLSFFCTTALACTPSREDNRDEAVSAQCSRAEECGKIGSGNDYATYDDCVVDQTKNFNDLWPADKCSDGRMNEVRTEDCIRRIEGASCNSNFFDTLSFLSECNADKVCIDPPE